MFLYCAVVIGLCTCLFLPWKRERQLCRGCTVHTCFGGYLRKKKWRLTPLFANIHSAETSILHYFQVICPRKGSAVLKRLYMKKNTIGTAPAKGWARHRHGARRVIDQGQLFCFFFAGLPVSVCGDRSVSMVLGRGLCRMPTVPPCRDSKVLNVTRMVSREAGWRLNYH